MAVTPRTLKASFMRQAHSDALAIVAQLVEQRIRNAWVAGSSPASGSKQKRHPIWGVYFCFTICHGREPLRGPLNARGVLGRSDG